LRWPFSSYPKTIPPNSPTVYPPFVNTVDTSASSTFPLALLSSISVVILLESLPC